MRRQAIVVFLVGIFNLFNAIFTIFNSELSADTEKATTSIGNMPKNIAEAGDTGKYTTIKLDGLNNPHIAYYDADSGNLVYTKSMMVRLEYYDCRFNW